MLGKKVKQFVCMGLNEYEKGFTLLEVLVTITILFTTLPLAAFLVSSATYTSNYDELSIQQFFQFLRDEFMLATEYAVSKNKFILHDPDGKEISFERYNDVVLRKVDNTGHDIYLRDVQNLNFISLPYGIQVEITSLKGETYEKTIIYYE